MPQEFQQLYDYDPLRRVLFRTSPESTDSAPPALLCRICSTAVDPTKVKIDSNGRPICADCYEIHYAHCLICVTLVLKSTSRSRTIRRNLDIADNAYVCLECYNTTSLSLPPHNIWSCRDCGSSWFGSAHAIVDRRNNSRCQVCAANRREQLNSIVDYSTDVTQLFPYYDSPKDNLLMGVELEVQVYGSTTPMTEAKKVRTIFPEFAICKKDSSIGSEGFEIVTVPASIDGHYKEWTKFFDEPIKATSWKSGQCGMHVHIARKAMSALTIGKLLQFVNDPMNQGLVATVAGRGSTEYCRIIEKKVTDAVSMRRLDYNPTTGNQLPNGSYRLYAENRQSNDRHEAINLNNTNTVELRIFRGTMNRTSFFKNLEFTHALVKFCGFVGITELTTPGFIGWLKSRHSTYPHLVQFLAGTKGRKFITNVRKIERKILKDGSVVMTNKPLLQTFIKENEEVFANV